MKLKTALTAITTAALVSCAPAPVVANESNVRWTQSEYCEFYAETVYQIAKGMKDGHGFSQRDVITRAKQTEVWQQIRPHAQELLKEYISDLYYWDWNADEAYERVYFQCFNYDS